MVENQLNSDQVRQVGLLARLELSEEDVDRLTIDLNGILAHFERLNQLNTENVEPTFHVLDLANVMREDKVQIGLPVEEVLQNAPDSDGVYFLAPRIVEGI